MVRCHESADILFPAQPILTADGFKERNFGQFEYKNYMQLQGNTNYQRFIDSGGTTNFPGAEPPEAFKKRCQDAFLSCIEQECFDAAEKKLAFVVHGGTIMSIFEMFGVPKKEYFAWQIPNAVGVLTELSFDESTKQVELIYKKKIAVKE